MIGNSIEKSIPTSIIFPAFVGSGKKLNYAVIHSRSDLNKTNTVKKNFCTP